MLALYLLLMAFLIRHSLNVCHLSLRISIDIAPGTPTWLDAQDPSIGRKASRLPEDGQIHCFISIKICLME